MQTFKKKKSLTKINEVIIVINKNWKELIKPRKIEFVKDKDNFTNAELVCLLYTSDAADEE